jgi:hypothetical protein
MPVTTATVAAAATTVEDLVVLGLSAVKADERGDKALGKYLTAVSIHLVGLSTVKRVETLKGLYESGVRVTPTAKNVSTALAELGRFLAVHADDDAATSGKAFDSARAVVTRALFSNNHQTVKIQKVRAVFAKAETVAEAVEVLTDLCPRLDSVEARLLAAKAALSAAYDQIESGAVFSDEDADIAADCARFLADISGVATVDVTPADPEATGLTLIPAKFAA